MRTISDRPATDSQSELDQAVRVRMGKYPEWRSMFTGAYLEQELKGATADPNTGEIPKRWPSQLNLFRAYALTHACFLWGRGETGRQSDDLFDFTLDDRIPGQTGAPPTSGVESFREALEYWWSFNQQMLRTAAAVQQWAGGCVLKLSWNPGHPHSVFGCLLELIDPIYFYPVWDPTSHDTLISASIRFAVSTIVAMEKYCLTPRQVADVEDGGLVTVTETWTPRAREIRCGQGDKSVIARTRTLSGNPGEKQSGPNPWVNPYTQRPIIPIWYVPRIRTNGFFGDSLMPDLVGPVSEINKALSDIGDAVNDSTHIKGAVADMHTLQARFQMEETIPFPAGGEILNLGVSGQDEKQGRYYPIPAPEVPQQTIPYMEHLQDSTDSVAMLTKAARGGSNSETAFGQSMQMLPTLYLIDWMRGHWSTTVAGRAGVCEALGTMWHVKREEKLNHIVPGGIPPSALGVRRRMRIKPVIPRDRIARVQEVAQLAANDVLPPIELMRRLGDIENLDEVVDQHLLWTMWKMAWESAVAGRSIIPGKELRRKGDENKKQPSLPLPEVVGEQPAKVKQPATQPGQQKKEPA